MRILIAGGGVFSGQLIGRLNRERHEVYIIENPKSQNEERTGSSGDSSGTKYYFELGDKKLDFVFSSVKPDAVIFLGAMNEEYDWSLHQVASTEMLSGLSNMLCLAVSNQVPRFIYLSSTEVYGGKYEERIDESFEKRPESVKNLVFSQGEEICKGFHEITGLQTVSLRLSSVYGFVTERRDDFASKMFFEALELEEGQEFSPPEDLIFSPTFVSDAVDAIYKAVVATDAGGGSYIVAGQDAGMLQIYREICKITGVTPVETEPPQEPVRTATADCAAISAKYNFRPIIGVETGLARMSKDVLKKRKQDIKAKKPKKEKNVFGIVAPFLENLFVFAVAVTLCILASGSTYMSEVDFLIFYVMIVAVTYGVMQSTVAVILASVFLLWQSTELGNSAVDFFTGLGVLLKMLQYFIIAAVCGYKTDRMKTTLDEKDLTLADAESELDAIYEINDRNMRIKQVLDNRLTNYENSLAKIYTVTDKLNSLYVDEVFFSAIDAVSEIMNSEDVSIYIVTGNASKMCRLVAKSPDSGRVLRKSIPLTDFGALAESMERDEIYVNRELDTGMPMLAAPVFSSRQLVSIIMIWSIGFEELTAYTVNNFLVLSKLISSIIEKAYVYSQTTTDVTHMQDTGVLKAEAYMEIYKVHEQASKSGIANHRVFEIDINAGNVEEIAGKIKGMLRNTDYIGWSKDGRLQVLLTNTNDNDAKFVYDRLTAAQIGITEVAV